MTTRRIIGIDPGLKHTGWGVIEAEGNRLVFIAAGTITTNEKEPLPNRLFQLHTELTEVLSRYQPQEAGVEETFINTNALSSLKLGHARGSLLLTLSMHHVPVSEYASRLVKKSVVGTGTAEKDQVMVMIKHLMPKAVIDRHDTADALAVAICHAHHSPMLAGMKS